MAEDWQEWIGRTEVAEDCLDEGIAARFAATLDRPAAADPAPQGIHWCLATPAVPAYRLGGDGHPLRDAGTLLPPVPLPRRMWAGSTVAFARPLRLGDPVRRTSRIDSVATKAGASGTLTFVEVAHAIAAGGTVAIRETQTIVYREAAAAPARPQPGGGFDPAGTLAHRVLHPDTPLLFRYSALTFNAHRIHYDLPYARDVEGYPGLVVHGPLIATLLLDLAREALGDQPFATFAWRGVSPAIAGEPLHLALWAESGGYRLGAFAGDGREVTRASASAR